MLREAICNVVRQAPDGLMNSDIARALQLESEHEGRQKNYLTYSIIGGLLSDGLLIKERRERHIYYKAASEQID